METDKIQRVLNSLKAIAEKYMAYHFGGYLFDNNYLDFDWADDTDPDTLPENELPAASLSSDALYDALSDYWHHYGGISFFLVYKNLDADVQQNPEVMKYVFDGAQYDAAQVVLTQCQTGKIYRTEFPSPKEIHLFTGSEEKEILADYADLYEIADEQHTYEELIEFQEQASELS